MNKKAFSFTEIIISLSLILFLLIPTLKINTQQILNFKKMNISMNELDFFDSVCSFLKNENIFFLSEDSFTFKSYEDLKKNSTFQNFEFSQYPKKNFELKINIRVSTVDFYSSSSKANIIDIQFSNNKKKLKGRIIKFIN